MTPAVAKKEYGVVMTSSPGPTFSAISATSSASVPDDTPTACRAPTNAAIELSKSVTDSPEDELLRVAHAIERGADVLADGGVLRLEVQQRDRRHRP